MNKIVSKYIKCKILRNSGGMHLQFVLFEDVICVLMKVVYFDHYVTEQHQIFMLFSDITLVLEV